MKRRPESEEELQKREAIGVIRASRFVRKYARSHKLITFLTIQAIHTEIFEDAWPEIAGTYRDENLKITDSKHLPPSYSTVPALMKQKEAEFIDKLKTLEQAEGVINQIPFVNNEVMERIDNVIAIAAWIHYIITFIHPFRDGNGRTARLAANLILERYGLVGISIKIEKENKNRYRQSLTQIDEMQDYEPLQTLIYEGLIDRYNGVQVKYYPSKRKKSSN